VTGPVRAAGVDGWRGRWVVATVGEHVKWAVARSAAEVVALTAECSAVAVDVPIGLADGPGGRACDLLARQRLGAARASVFPAPHRRTLHADSHAEAVKITHAVGLPGMSIQAWNLVPGIRDWDDVLAADARGDRIVECHPEVSFRALAPEVSFARKVTGRGVGQRLDALAPWVDAVGALRELPDGQPVPAADALDALACAWTASRWAVGTAVTLPAEPPRDDRGLPMRIVY
jgi:predicted RNase H-like nuclease